MSTFVNHRGEPIDMVRLQTEHKPAPKAKPTTMKAVDNRDEATHSMGFVVLGYPPDAMAYMREVYASELRSFNEKPEKSKSPGTLDEFAARWMRTNKPKRGRTKPFEIGESADAMADLLRRAGWEYVRVEELLRREQ